MKFKLKKNEKILLSVLAILLYCLIMYKFIYVPVVPEIAEQKSNITTMLLQKQKLEEDLSKLYAKKSELQSKKAADERLAAYLSNEANVTDCVEYIDKLSEIMGSNISNINIAAPVAKEIGKSRYFEIKVDFNTRGSLKKIMDMVTYIENSSKVARIGRFQIKIPEKDEEKGIKGKETKEVVYNASMTLNMYSLNTEAADKLYEYGRHKFNRYEDGSEKVFDGSDKLETKETSNTGQKNNSIKSNNTSVLSDFLINLNSFLKAGDNFIVLGTDKSEDTLSIKTNKLLSMDMSVSDNLYIITVSEQTGKTYKLRGIVPDRELKLEINAVLSSIAENRDLELKLKIENNSSKNIKVLINDKSGRVTLTDRQGNVINEGSTSERIKIV